MACELARSIWLCALAEGPVIHCELPSAHAIAPSVELATLRGGGVEGWGGAVGWRGGVRGWGTGGGVGEWGRGVG